MVDITEEMIMETEDAIRKRMKDDTEYRDRRLKEGRIEFNRIKNEAVSGLWKEAGEAMDKFMNDPKDHTTPLFILRTAADMCSFFGNLIVKQYELSVNDPINKGTNQRISDLYSKIAKWLIDIDSLSDLVGEAAICQHISFFIKEEARDELEKEEKLNG